MENGIRCVVVVIGTEGVLEISTEIRNRWIVPIDDNYSRKKYSVSIGDSHSFAPEMITIFPVPTNRGSRLAKPRLRR
jgi:hypothetical protein